MNDRWIAIAPLAAEEALRAVVETAAAPLLRRELPWVFFSGKTTGYDTARGTLVRLTHHTTLDHLVVTVIDDGDGLVERITASVPVENLDRLAQRFEAASTDREKIRALTALAAAQALAGGASLPMFVDAAARSLDDPSPLVRLAAIRMVGFLPASNAFEMLDGRDDPDNPEIGSWRRHYRRILDRD